MLLHILGVQILLNFVTNRSDHYLNQDTIDLIHHLYETNPYKNYEPTKSHLNLRKLIEGTNEIYAPLNEAELPLFNEMYYLRNITKCMIAYQKVALSNSLQKIRDLGCGPGSASIALELLNQTNREPKQLEYILDDRSKKQLTAAERNFSFHFNKSKISKTAEDHDLCVASYSVCEMLNEKKSFKEIHKKLSTEYMVIDYGRVILKLLKYNTHSFESVNSHSLTIILPPSLREIFGQETLHMSFLHARRST